MWPELQWKTNRRSYAIYQMVLFPRVRDCSRSQHILQCQITLVQDNAIFTYAIWYHTYNGILIKKVVLCMACLSNFAIFAYAIHFFLNLRNDYNFHL